VPCWCELGGVGFHELGAAERRCGWGVRWVVGWGGGLQLTPAEAQQLEVPTRRGGGWGGGWGVSGRGTLPPCRPNHLLPLTHSSKLWPAGQLAMRGWRANSAFLTSSSSLLDTRTMVPRNAALSQVGSWGVDAQCDRV
jgi:hypothetical protein